VITRRTPLKRGKPPKLGQPPKRSRKPIAKLGNAGRKRKARYAAYLKSPRWKELKLVATVRSGFRCERCGVGIEDARLECHHKKYPRVLGTEKLTDLEVLCTYCHRAHHSKDMKRRIA
jgi:hypothetical protein